MCQATLRPDLFRENRVLVVGSPVLVVEGRLQKKDGTLSIRAGRSERMSLEEPILELRKPVSPPDPRRRESTPQSHGFRQGPGEEASRFAGARPGRTPSTGLGYSCHARSDREG